MNGSSGVPVGARRDAVRIDAVDAVAAQHEQRVELLEVLDEQRARAASQLRRCRRPPPRRRPRPARGRLPGGSTPAARARGSGPAPRTRAPRRRCRGRRRRGLGLAQREHAHLGELAPERAVEALLLELAQRLDRDAPVAERPDARAQRLLIVAELEVHAASLARLPGQPQDPLGDDVALDLRRARGDGQRERLQRVVRRSPATAARRRRRATARRGRAARIESSPIRCFSSE